MFVSACEDPDSGPGDAGEPEAGPPGPPGPPPAASADDHLPVAL